VDNIVHVRQRHVTMNFRIEKTSAQIPQQESLHWFHVIGTEHPAEVMMQLQVSCGPARLVHHSNDIRAAQSINYTHTRVNINVSNM